MTCMPGRAVGMRPRFADQASRASEECYVLLLGTARKDPRLLLVEWSRGKGRYAIKASLASVCPCWSFIGDHFMAIRRLWPFVLSLSVARTQSQLARP